MKKINLFLTIFISLLIVQFAFIPKTISETPVFKNLHNSQIPISSIHIAIYNEPNITETSYSAGGTYTNDYNALMGFLQAEGHKATELTCTDIYNHELLTADYDLFIMVDNLPRENITKYVKEFWLGGGGLLSFDSALPYLLYEGILIPESEGDHGWGTYFVYQAGISHNISTRHPITKDYQVEDKFSSAGTWMNYLYWDILLGTSAGADTIKLANRDTVNNYASAVARDPLDKGGRVVHLPGLGNAIGVNMSGMISEAVQWLCPKPKGRILFDLSHLPYYGIDPWDDYVSSVNYNIWRNTLVSRGYTLDKLYPSITGNLTTNNLLPYDMLFICMPEINFTSSEVVAVTQWVENGGGLIAIGENAIFIDNNNNINYLYSNFDLELNSVTGTNGATYFVVHPTTEDCVEITAIAPGTVVYSGDAYPIWGYDDTEIYVAGQEYGDGRVLLMGEVGPFRDSNIADLDNLQYAINVANWLTADDAKILIYVHNPSTPDPNDNIYRGPVANALNELGYSFYMTFTKEYLNLSLSTGLYKLVVIDNSEFSIMDTVGMTLLNFLKTGGYLILSTYEYRLATYNYLWDYIGIAYAGNYFTSPQSINIWNPTHPIFSSPAQYSASTLETSLNFITTDYTNLTLHSNATAIAGLTLTSNVNGSAIILGASNHVITNAMHLTEYFDDTDDDTYPDALQLWKNEIAYMWVQISPGGPGGIPSYDLFIVIGSVFVCISLISLVMLKKRKNLLIQ